MDLQALLLALIQGITEFLPISSSAHLILPKEVLGWPDQGLAFDVAVHLGTLTAVICYFRRDLYELGTDVLGNTGAQRRNALHLIYCLILATLPAALAGLLLEDLVETHLRSALVIAVTTLLGAFLLWGADRHAQGAAQVRELWSISYKAALAIGLAQALALIPGTSRSGITITMALFLGFSREASARFSFLLSIPIIALSGGWQALGLLEESGVDWARLISAMLVAALAAFACIKLFLGFIERIGMLPFVYYRLLLGAALMIWVFAGG